MANEDKKVLSRVSSVRTRTWILTASILIAVVLYIFVNLFWEETISVIDMLMLATIQTITHFAFFPEGELYGENDEKFILNREAYNTKATAINEQREVGQLREYCEYDFQRRKDEYVKDELGALGITGTEYAELKKKSPREIRKLAEWEFDGKILYFTKRQRKRLFALLFHPVPVEKNKATTILSAVDYDTTKAIRNGKIAYKNKKYIGKILKAFVGGMLLAYIGYGQRDGITVADVARAVTCFVSMLTTAVTSYTRGETSTRVYQNQFYIDLTVFIDEFFGWLKNEKSIDFQIEEDSTEQ